MYYALALGSVAASPLPSCDVASDTFVGSTIRGCVLENRSTGITRTVRQKERKKKKHTTSYPSSRRRFIGVGEGEDDVPDSTRREAGASSLSRHGRRNHFASARSSGARSRPLARANVAQSRGSATPAADPGFERPRGVWERGRVGERACRLREGRCPLERWHRSAAAAGLQQPAPFHSSSWPSTSFEPSAPLLRRCASSSLVRACARHRRRRRLREEETEMVRLAKPWSMSASSSGEPRRRRS